jgi:hypothetical protein
MATRKRMKTYELWRSVSTGSDFFFEVDDACDREALDSDAILVCTIRAASWNEAQQKRYDFMGWGHYKTFEEDMAERGEPIYHQPSSDDP